MGVTLKIATILGIICLLGHGSLGAPTKGRYMWVRCKPDAQNANCVQEKGALMKLPGPSTRLPPSAVNTISKVDSSEETDSEEISGNGPSPQQTWFPEVGSGEELTVAEEAEEPEGSGMGNEGSGGIDDTNYVYPEKRTHIQVSQEELKVDDVIV